MVDETKTPIPITPVTRKSFSLEFKRYVVRYINNAMANKMASITVACKCLCIPHFYYKRWKKMLQNVNYLKKANNFMLSKSILGAKKIILDIQVNLKRYAVVFHDPYLNFKNKAFKSVIALCEITPVACHLHSMRKV